MSDRPAPLDRWHDVVRAQDPALLTELLHPDCVFRSPALHRPQEGRELTTTYLTGALAVLGPTLTYVHEWYDARSAVLEFTADLGGRTVHGVDMLRWDEDGRLTSFTVMVRPLTGLTELMQRMVTELGLSADQPAGG